MENGNQGEINIPEYNSLNNKKFKSDYGEKLKYSLYSIGKRC